MYESRVGTVLEIFCRSQTKRLARIVSNVMVEFVVKSKIHSVTKISLFMANYKRKLRMRVDIRKRGKVEKMTEFVERMKKIQEEVEVTLRKAQKKIKQQADKERKEAEKWKKENKVVLSTKYLMFKERPVKKLVD